MALVVEDGTVVAGANSYVDMSYADAYHSSRNNVAWLEGASSPDTAREGALIRATQWLDATYKSRYPGLRLQGRTQPLQWPRSGAYDVDGNEIAEDEIPQEIMAATCEAALRELSSPGSLAPDYNNSQRVVSEKVGDLAVTYSDSTSAADMTPVFSMIDGILSSLFVATQDGSNLLFGESTRI